VIPHVEFKAILLLALTALLIIGFVGYVLYARGTFDSTQRLILVTEDSEGVFFGMDLTYAGFAIGRVKKIQLGEDGKAHVEIAVPKKDARWLRTTSVFKLEKSLVGGARIRAVTGVLDDPPLPDGAVRPVLRGDTTEEIPRLIATMGNLLENLERMSGSESSLNLSIGNVHTVTTRMAGKYGALAGVLGSDENAKKVIAALDRTNVLLDSANGLTAKIGGVTDKIGGVTQKVDGTLDKTDQRLFGPGGVMDEAQKTVQQLNTMLGDARESLKKVDAVLVEAQKIGANTRVATEDLGTLRAEVEASLRKVSGLIEEINRKWPFARDREIKLP